MTLLERVKERTKTELADPEIQHMINEANAEIVRRYGELIEPIEISQDSPSVDPVLSTVTVRGGARSLFLLGQNIDVAGSGEDLEIVEIDGTVETTLDADDFRVWHGGRRIERLSTGTNGRSEWGELVRISFRQTSDRLQRDEVIIKLVILSMNYEGVSSDKIDGYATTFSDFTKEKESLLASLGSRVRMA